MDLVLIRVKEGWRMALWLRAFAVFSEDLSSDPSTHTRYLTIACNYSSPGSDALLWPLWVLHARDAHTDKQTHTHRLKIKGLERWLKG